jgi:hypothetical protein
VRFFVPSGLEQEHVDIRIFGKAARDDRAG